MTLLLHRKPPRPLASTPWYNLACNNGGTWSFHVFAYEIVDIAGRYHSEVRTRLIPWRAGQKATWPKGPSPREAACCHPTAATFDPSAAAVVGTCEGAIPTEARGPMPAANSVRQVARPGPKVTQLWNSVRQPGEQIDPDTHSGSGSGIRIDVPCAVPNSASIANIDVSGMDAMPGAHD